MPSRLFAIGDIHGCSVALKTLIDAINPQADDTIVVLGDVIDWGPDSRACVQQLIDLSGRCQFVLVRGNHEEMLFAALESQRVEVIKSSKADQPVILRLDKEGPISSRCSLSFFPMSPSLRGLPVLPQLGESQNGYA